MDYKLQIQNTRRVPHTAVLPDLARTSLWSSALALWSRFKVQTLAFLPPEVYLHTATRLSPKAMLMLTMFLQKDSHHGSCPLLFFFAPALKNNVSEVS